MCFAKFYSKSIHNDLIGGRNHTLATSTKGIQLMLILKQTSNRRPTLRHAGCFFTALVAALVFIALPGTIHADLIAYEDFDTDILSNNTLSSRTISRGSWTDTYQSSTQIFGITDRAEALSEGASNMVDTSTSGSVDFYGILKTTDTSSLFAVERPGSNFSATWEFDISKAASNLSLGIDFAAMGDWASFSDAFKFDVALGSGESFTLIESGYKSGTHRYYMEKTETHRRSIVYLTSPTR